MKYFNLRVASLRPDKQSLRTKKEGFSLVEIVLAIGIVAFVLVGLLGLMSVALNSTRKSTEDYLSGQIASYVYEELETDSLTAENLSATRPSPFNPSNTYPLIRTFFFTKDGAFLGYASNALAGSNAFFLVTATIAIPNMSPASITPNSTITQPSNFPDISALEIRSVNAKVSWPVNPTTGSLPAGAKSAQFSFLLSKGIYLSNPNYPAVQEGPK